MVKNRNDRLTVFACAAAFVINTALFCVKLYVGLSANSISIYSDAVNNMFDSVSALAAFVCLWVLFDMKSPRLGAVVKKAEQFFTFLMSAVVLVTGLYFAYNSLERLLYPTPVSYLSRYLVMLLVTVAVKLVMYFVYRGAYRLTGSPVIKLMTADSILDCFITLATVMSLTVSQYVEFAVDAVFGIAISAVLVVSAVKSALASGAVMIDYVDKATRDAVDAVFSELGVSCGYLSYRKLGRETEAFVRIDLPEGADADELKRQLCTACLEKTGVVLNILE